MVFPLGPLPFTSVTEKEDNDERAEDEGTDDDNGDREEGEERPYPPSSSEATSVPFNEGVCLSELEFTPLDDDESD